MDEDALEEDRKRREKEEQAAAAATQAKASKAPPKGAPIVQEEEEGPPNHFSLGSQPIQDSQGGDAGPLLWPSAVFSIPQVYFTHSLVVGKLSASDNPQSLSKRLVSSNLYVVYEGLPIIDVYKLQEADMSAVRKDHTYEECASRINAWRKANEKQTESGSSLLAIVKQINSKQEQKKATPACAPKRLRLFTLPYAVSASTFTLLNESHQWLGVGMKDGSIVVIDAVLAVEKYFFPKHAKAVSTMAFYSNVSLLSGGEDGVVHIYDIRGSGEDEGIDTPNKVGSIVYKGNNVMDRSYPIIKCCVSEAGLGVVTDIMGNARVYDLLRHSKVCKLAPFLRQTTSEADSALHDTWRFLPRVCFHVQRDIVTAIA